MSSLLEGRGRSQGKKFAVKRAAKGSRELRMSQCGWSRANRRVIKNKVRKKARVRSASASQASVYQDEAVINT